MSSSSRMSTSSSEGSDPSYGSSETVPNGARDGFYQHLINSDLSVFCGNEGEEAAGRFLAYLEVRFRRYDYSTREMVVLAYFCLRGEAREWWESIQELATQIPQGDEWAQFHRAFTVQYSPSIFGRVPPRLIYSDPDPAILEEMLSPPRGEISGRISVNGHLARALFDLGSSGTIIKSNFVQEKGMETRPCRMPSRVTYGDGGSRILDRQCENCRVVVGEMCTFTTMLLGSVHNYDVIIGMDWLRARHTYLDLRRKVIVFNIPGQD